MKIPDAVQIREWDQFTIQHEPIASINLMERAANKCVEWLEQNGYTGRQFTVFCGKGNNGGDGLAIARLLVEKGAGVAVYILEFGHRGTDDFQQNLEMLHQYPAIDIHFIQDENSFHDLDKDEIVIDALFGSGLTRPLEGVTKKLVGHVNKSGCTVISIDIPSGLAVNSSSKDNTVIRASHTLSFQCNKLAFLVAENASFTGKVHILDIGLHNDYYKTLTTDHEITDASLMHSVYKPRNKFSHKGNYGHALIIAGSYGKMGAAVLAAKACLQSGAGLLTCHIPKSGYEIIQSAVPEAMVTTDSHSSMITKIETDLSVYNAIGVGPGIGTSEESISLLKQIFIQYKKPVVVDADALNCLSLQKDILDMLPPYSILTPHPKEFDRLFGECKNDFERMEKAISSAKSLNCIVVLKGHHTFIATPEGKGFFNNTGNPGMATAGSGDALTGILTGLLAQGYNSQDATLLGVYIHGLAGDLAANERSEEAMIAGDIIEFLGKAFLLMRQ